VITPAVASPAATLALLGIVALLAAMLMLGVRRACERSADPPVVVRLAAVIAGGVLLIVLGATWGLASSGWLLDVEALPPRLIVVVGATTFVTCVLALSPIGARLATGLPVAWLIGYQGFRVPVELLLWKLSHESVMPQPMTFEGRNFDILTGISAIILGVVAARRPLPRSALLLWNVLGFALLAHVVFLAIAATPYFPNYPGAVRNTLVFTAPWIWLPCILVQAALFGHVLVFRRLLRPEPMPEMDPG
jgi:hypothetical protein